MGFFRRLKLTDMTAEQCKRKLAELGADMADSQSPYRCMCLAEEWAVVRELLARHEGDNKSPLDEGKG